MADYAAALLAELREHGARRGGRRRAAMSRSITSATTRCMPRSTARALERPGVVVLHDAVLHHFFLGQLSEPRYVDEFVYNYGEWNRGLARDLWRGRAASGADDRYFDYPMLKRVAERSRADRRPQSGRGAHRARARAGGARRRDSAPVRPARAARPRRTAIRYPRSARRPARTASCSASSAICANPSA